MRRSKKNHQPPLVPTTSEVVAVSSPVATEPIPTPPSESGTGQTEHRAGPRDGTRRSAPRPRRSPPSPTLNPVLPAASPSGDSLEDARQHLSETVRRATEEIVKETSRLRQECAELRKLLRALPEEIATIRRDAAASRPESVVVQPAAPEPAPEPQPPEPPAAHNPLGVTVAPGVVVAEVTADTLAARAGVTAGDVIVEVNGVAAANGTQLREMLQAVHGTETVLRISRGGVEQDVRVPADATPNSAESDHRLGVSVASGVIVAEVTADAPASRAGLAAGDVITAVNGVPVTGGLQLRELVLQAALGGALLLTAARSGETKVFTILIEPPASPG